MIIPTALTILVEPWDYYTIDFREGQHQGKAHGRIPSTTARLEDKTQTRGTEISKYLHNRSWKKIYT